MLKLVEIIGSDEIEDLDPETLYFIVNLLNKAKIKKVKRNSKSHSTFKGLILI